MIMATYIYGDVILAENFMMDLIILWCTARLTRYKYAWIKLTIASALGAGYALFSYFPEYSYLYSFTLKILFSIVVVIIAYTPTRFDLLLRLTGVFYIVSFVFGGAAFGLFYFTNGLRQTWRGISFIDRFPLKLLIAAVIIAFLTVKYSWEYVQHRIKREKILTLLEIQVNGKTVALDVLIDTGNALKDPITSVPVIIAEYQAMDEVFPDEIKDVFRQEASDLQILAQITALPGWASRFRVIPFKSLGKENGMLVGFRPDRITVLDGNERIEIRNAVVAVYRRSLSRDGEYHGLINPDMLKRME